MVTLLPTGNWVLSGAGCETTLPEPLAVNFNPAGTVAKVSGT